MKVGVKNYSLRDYFKLPFSKQKEINFNLRNGTFIPIDSFNIGPFEDLSFSFVKDTQEQYITKGIDWIFLIESLKTLKGIEYEELIENSVYQLFSQKLFFKAELDKIIELEKKLHPLLSQKEINSGIEDFSKFRSFLQYDNLAKGDITKFEEIGKMPYMICFTKLLLEKELSDYNRKINNFK